MAVWNVSDSQVEFDVCGTSNPSLKEGSIAWAVFQKRTYEIVRSILVQLTWAADKLDFLPGNSKKGGMSRAWQIQLEYFSRRLQKLIEEYESLVVFTNVLFWSPMVFILSIFPHLLWNQLIFCAPSLKGSRNFSFLFLLETYKGILLIENDYFLSN